MPRASPNHLPVKHKLTTPTRPRVYSPKPSERDSERQRNACNLLLHLHFCVLSCASKHGVGQAVQITPRLDTGISFDSGLANTVTTGGFFAHVVLVSRVQ